MLAGTLLFAVQPAVSKRVRSGVLDEAAGLELSTGARAGILAASVYGAYFGAGLGVMLLAVLGLGLHLELQQLNAVKNSLSLMINTVALVAFARAHGNQEGQIFALIVMVVAACEVAVGLGLIVALYRRRIPIDVDEVSELRG